ncbi:MAG: FHA domain-containing protein [Lachnospiraceae bacterium]|nr:FHA domain-containing protein [Lachnospiraceae bacterium]
MPEENQIQEEEMSEEIETQVGEEIQEEELPVEDELQEDEPPVDEIVQEAVEEEIPEEAIEEDVKEETVVDSTAQDIVNKLKNKVIGGKKKTNTSENEESDESEEDKKKPIFKTKEVTGVVIPDELDEFLAEKEREEREEQENKEIRHEETSLKIKKNIKVNRASIVKNTQEELKEGEPEKEETEAASAKTDASEETKNDNGEAAADTGAEQNGGKAGILKSAPAPKVNPYLVRVNTEERIMITKQTFKMGKASMGVDYTVKGNGAVSRVHAIITNKDGEYFVRDNKSTNHTYVNGKILNDGDNEPLTHDSKIMLGDEEFIFKLQ